MSEPRWCRGAGRTRTPRAVSACAASEQPQFFALGIGVAGPKGVLAQRNANTTGDGKGIDHIEQP
jgi:hypothetical protein